MIYTIYRSILASKFNNAMKEKLFLGVVVGIFTGFAIYWICFRKFCKRRSQEKWIKEIDKKHKKIRKKEEEELVTEEVNSTVENDEKEKTE